MASSVQGAASTGLSARGNRSTFDNSASQEYQVILPHLPSAPSALNNIFLHADMKRRPYKVEDCRDTVVRLELLPEVIALGAYQMNHIWAATFKDPSGAKNLVAASELQVKGRRCLIIGPGNQDVRFKLHWGLHYVPDGEVRRALGPYGKVTEVASERWRVPGYAVQASTMRLVTLRLKAGVSVDDIPHQVRLVGENALVVVPGREPLCLRCHRSAHIRRECRVPRCALCRRFGHDESHCVRTYAKVAERQTEDRTAEYIMDAEDAEDAAKGEDKEVVKDTPPMPAPAVVPEDTTPKEIAVAQEEPESTDNASAAERGREADGAPSHAQADEMENAGVGSFNTSAKRAREAAANDEGIGELGTEEPPAKAVPQGRRSTLKPKSSIPPEEPR